MFSLHRLLLRRSILCALFMVGCAIDESPTAPKPYPGPASQVSTIAVAPFLLASVDAGGGHTCGFRDTGRLFCWGYNNAGQLGIGTLGETDTAIVPRVTRPPAGSTALAYTQVSAGAFHTCGVAAGKAYCWGYNDDGSLGNGSLSGHSTRPVAVVGGRSWRRVVADDHHTCGLTTADRLFCWGSNLFGELGIGASGVTAPGVTVPTEVVGGRTWISLDVGSNFSCGVATGGQAFCWGDNYRGKLGTGMAIDSASSPVRVAGQYQWARITTGSGHACALSTGGVAQCWGSNLVGQLGTGTSGGSSPIPVAVTGGRVFKRLIAGTDHTCGLVSNGRAFCWGGNTFGQLGLGGAGGSTSEPRAVVAPSGGSTLFFRQISAGASYTCGVTTAGKTYCWGAAYFGALGIGPRAPGANSFPRPMPVARP